MYNKNIYKMYRLVNFPMDSGMDPLKLLSPKYLFYINDKKILFIIFNYNRFYYFTIKIFTIFLI